MLEQHKVTSASKKNIKSKVRRFKHTNQASVFSFKCSARAVTAMIVNDWAKMDMPDARLFNAEMAWHYGN